MKNTPLIGGGRGRVWESRKLEKGKTGVFMGGSTASDGWEFNGVSVKEPKN